MKSFKHLCLSVFLSAMFGGIFFLPYSSALAEDSVVICNKSVADNELSKKDMEDIFLGKKTRWSDNQKITFVILKGGEAHISFLSRYVDKTESQFIMYWKKMVFTGEGRLPKAFDTPEELLKYVSETSGAIGYVPANAASDRVKTLIVR